MPRNVRNFWIEGRIDGRAGDIEGGPQSRDGGFRIGLYQRHNGEVVRVAGLDGWMGNDGRLFLDFATCEDAAKAGGLVIVDGAARADGAVHVRIETAR